MPRISLTQQGIKAMKVEKRTEFWDKSFGGFGVRVSPQGHKVFVLMVRQNGVLRRLKLGEYPDVSLAEARRRAEAAVGRKAEGDDPVRTGVTKGGFTFEDLAEEYLELYARRKKRSWEEDERILRRDVLPKWGHLLAKEVRRRDVIRLLDETVKRGAPVQANRTRALISRVFSWALKRDLVESNPCAGVERPAKERPREPLPSPDEIRALWAGLDHEDPAIANGLRLILLTAQRGVEVRLMAWAQIDGDRWTIPGEITKNGRKHLVRLSKQAQRVIESCRTPGGSLVLPSSRGAGAALSPEAMSHAARRIVKRLGFQFTPHDLRRTASTLMGSLGVEPFIIGRVLNHTDGSTTGVYNLYSYWKEKVDALDRLGEGVEEIVGDQSLPRGLPAFEQSEHVQVTHSPAG